METVHEPSIPLPPPSSPLSTLLSTFFNPARTLTSIAAALGLTLEGLLNYIAIPEVAAALDYAEDLFLRRAELHATAALESVHAQLQALPARRPSSNTSPRRDNREATQRDSRSYTPRTTQRTTPANASSAQSLAKPRREAPPSKLRGRSIHKPSPARDHPLIALEPIAPVLRLYIASSARPSFALELRRDQVASVASEPDLRYFARELLGPPYKYKQAA